ncbi:MAG: ATP-binding cassette domain-containing protein, partial [Thermofilaceae archaeon]
MYVVELQDVWKVYGIGEAAVPALKGITFGIMKSEFIALVGPSGSGKSTLLHLIGGLDRPTRGLIKVEGVEVSSLRDDRELSAYRNERVG